MRLSVYNSQTHMRFLEKELKHIGIENQDRTIAEYVKVVGNFTEGVRIFKSSAQEQREHTSFTGTKVYKIVYPRDLGIMYHGHVGISKGSSSVAGLETGTKSLFVDMRQVENGKPFLYVKVDTNAVIAESTAQLPLESETVQVAAVSEPVVQQTQQEEPAPPATIADTAPLIETPTPKTVVTEKIIHVPTVNAAALSENKLREFKELSADLNKMLAIHPSLFAVMVDGKLALEQEVDVYEEF